ncbi:MAG: 4'-phosphopantetheinyl transferase superfamily protein [Bacteroidales bacterium]
MSLFLKKIVDSACLGIWEINESVEELYDRVHLSQEEKEFFARLKSPTRKQHWLSYRLILPHLVQKDELTTIGYDEYGKPFLNNGVRHISVSHSGRFSALIASPGRSVGIDIEKIDPKIFAVSHKFLNNLEITQVFSEKTLETLYLIWAGKEALYKLYGKRDLLFRENIRIFPFRYQGQGTFYGEIYMPGYRKIFTLYYQTIDDYILVYSIDS